MRQVRQVLGPDALIVSNRSVDGGIEVLATVDGAFDEAAGQAQQPPQQHASQQAPQPATHHAPYQEQTPAVMPPTAYPAPSRPIAAYQSAYAASALPEDEDEAGMMPASAPAAPVRVEIPPLPSAAPVRMEMPPLAPAAPVRMEMPPLQAAPQARAPAMPAVPPVAPQGYARPPAPQQQPMPQQHAAPQPPATPPAYRAAPQAYAQPAAQPAARPPVAPAAPAAPMHAAQPAPQPPAAPMPQAPRPPAAPMARMPDAPMPQGLALPPGTLPADTAAGLQNAISALRGALESRMDGLLWGGRQGPGREPAGAALFRSLLDAGFSTKLVRTLVERMPEGLDADAALAWARNELVTHLPVLGSEDTFLSGGVYALVGPTGVGKTTTLAKLAARCVAREGRDQVAMLTTDNFRIGALEQLQIYGRLMGVPTHSVRDAGELRRLLAELGSRKIVLIDTTGISQRDRHVAEQAAMLCDAGKTVRRLLVLNAASQGDTLDEVAHAYRNGVGEDVAGCIITKLDEASRLGAALDTAIRHRLPIHYMSVGQKVPEHLELARPDALIDRAFAMVERARALYTPSEADLASLWSSAGNAGRRPGAASAVAGLGHPAAAGRGRGGGGGAESGRHAELAGQRSGLRRARASWREYVSDGAGSSLSALADEPLAMARREFSAVCGRHLLVMHGKVGMKGDNLPGGTLLGSMLMSDRGAALAAPAQQLALAHGMLSSFAPGAAAQPDPAAALEARVRWLGGQLGQVPLVHMLEAGTSALWSALTEQGVSWVARSPGGLRVIQDECPTNLNAVGKSVGYLPVGQPGDMPGLRPVAGGRAAPLALWASGTEIGLPGRAGESAMRLVCARLIDTVSGEVVAQFFGLTNLPASQADAGTVARWLVLQDEAKAGFRYMANAWQALPAVDGAHALARQALMAG